MWFKKKKEQSEQIKIPCSTDKNLTECDSVSIIRDCQKQIEEIKPLTIGEIVNKYLHQYSYFDIVKLEAGRSLYNFMESKNEEFENYEQLFASIGRDLDNYENKRNILNKLNSKIEKEKEKLGIK